MKPQYLIDTGDLKRLRKMIKLLDSAITEIIQAKKLKTEKLDPHGPAQSDLIEEEWFARQQLTFFEESDPTIYK